MQEQKYKNNLMCKIYLYTRYNLQSVFKHLLNICPPDHNVWT